MKMFVSDTRATSAVEFALVACPFILVLMMILQLGVYYMTQSALDIGVLNTVEAYRNAFTLNQTFTPPTGAAVKASVAANAGGLITNDSTLTVDVQQLTTLAAQALPISDQVADFGSATSSLALRAQSSVICFVPGCAQTLTARAVALMRRQGH